MSLQDEIAPEVRKLFDSLASEIASIPYLERDDVTVPRLAFSTGRKRTFVERMLFEKVRKGELVCVSCFDAETGRRVNAYREPKLD